MSISYAKRAKDICFKQNITLLDQSTLKEYRITLIAPEGQVLLFTETTEYTHVDPRKKGSRKEPFWYQVFCTAEGGTVNSKELERMNRVWEISDKAGTLNPSSTRDSFVKGWFPPPPKF